MKRTVRNTDWMKHERDDNCAQQNVRYELDREANGMIEAMKW